MNYKPKILAFAGSLRNESYNKKLIKIAIKGAQEAGGEVTYIDLKDYPLPVYDQDLEDKEGLPENVMKLKQLLWSHDGFLISSPEYNSSIPGVLKNLIDWVSRKAKPEEIYLSCFIEKVIVLMSASPGYYGGLRGLTHLREVFSNVYSLVLPSQKCVSEAHLAFDSSGNIKDSKKNEEILNLGKKLVEFLKKI